MGGNASGNRPDNIVAQGQEQLATFASGCFWGVEKSFRKKYAAKLLDCQVGYVGGSVDHPTYNQICSGQTGHAEAIQIRFDPAVISYDSLVDFFYRSHDPTTRNSQGNDFGSQYRSTIFYHGTDQKILAEEGTKMAQTHFGASQIQTTVEPMKTFWPAESDHQQYLTDHPHGYECSTHFERTWERIEKFYNKL